jgi:F0F1-type ATP synthase epsilon subunit
MKHKAADTQFDVIARAPFHIYYVGPATAISAANRVGAFDILPGHADFFSILTPGQVTIDTIHAPDAPPEPEKSDEAKEADVKLGIVTQDNSVTFKISNGIIAVRDGKVMLFVNM